MTVTIVCSEAKQLLPLGRNCSVRGYDPTVAPIKEGSALAGYALQYTSGTRGRFRRRYEFTVSPEFNPWVIREVINRVVNPENIPQFIPRFSSEWWNERIEHCEWVRGVFYVFD